MKHISVLILFTFFNRVATSATPSLKYYIILLLDITCPNSVLFKLIKASLQGVNFHLSANFTPRLRIDIMLRENLLIFPCLLFGTYLFVNFHI